MSVVDFREDDLAYLCFKHAADKPGCQQLVASLPIMAELFDDLIRIERCFDLANWMLLEGMTVASSSFREAIALVKDFKRHAAR